MSTMGVLEDVLTAENLDGVIAHATFKSKEEVAQLVAAMNQGSSRAIPFGARPSHDRSRMNSRCRPQVDRLPRLRDRPRRPSRPLVGDRASVAGADETAAGGFNTGQATGESIP